jgi:hypothetical protein
MLRTSADDRQKAFLNYELYKNTGEAAFRENAVRLLSALYDQSPKVIYKQMKEELEGSAYFGGQCDENVIRH